MSSSFTLFCLIWQVMIGIGAVVLWLSLMHYFIQLSLNSVSGPAQILLTTCRRFAMVRISDNGRSTISQKQFIIIVIIIITNNNNVIEFKKRPFDPLLFFVYVRTISKWLDQTKTTSISERRRFKEKNGKIKQTSINREAHTCD